MEATGVSPMRRSGSEISAVILAGPVDDPAGVTLARDGTVVVLTGTEMRHLRIGTQAVLERVYFSIRDQGWNTWPLQVRDLGIESGDDHTIARVRGFANQVASTIEVELTVEIRAGAIEISARMTSGEELLSNRIGLCLHVPAPDFEGRPFRYGRDHLAHSDAFPAMVHPQYQSDDGRLSAMTGRFNAFEIDLDDRSYVRMDFSGSDFEMEDQRNWTDANWKIYGPTLSDPSPTRLAAGEEFVQKLRVRLLERAEPKPGSSDPGEDSDVSPSVRVAPRVGVCITAPLAADPGAAAISALAPSYLSVAVPAGPDVNALSACATSLGAATGTPLELRLHHPSVPELESVLAQARSDGAVVERVIISLDKGRRATAPAEIAELAECVAVHAKSADLFYGVDGFFADWNRERFLPRRVDGVAFAVSPQVHVGDEEAILRSAASYQSLVRTVAAERTDAFKVGFAPFSLRTVGGPYPAQAYRSADPAADPRLAGALGAAWLISAVSQGASAGVDSLSVHELCGPAGMLQVAEGVGRWSPSAVVLGALMRASGSRLVQADSPVAGVDMISCVAESGNRMMVAVNRSLSNADLGIDIAEYTTIQVVDLAPGAASIADLTHGASSRLGHSLVLPPLAAAVLHNS